MSKRDIHFSENGWTDYLYWQQSDQKVIKKINKLLVETQRNPGAGIGKPERLRGDYAGLWSRRITEEHRLVYAVTATTIRVTACRFHYDKRKS